MEGYRLVSEVPVRFADTDALGHVNNANYLSYLEAARVDYLRAVLGCEKVEEFGVILARVLIDYRSPAFHFETMCVGCRVKELGGSSIVMQYRVEDEASGRLVAEAETVLVTFDYGRKKPVRMKDEWRAKMEAYDGIA